MVNPQEGLLKRFQRSVQNSGLLREVKAKRFFISNGEKARIAARKSAARAPAPSAQGGRSRGRE
ncbi:MAG: bS21 family ribosomal protein [Hymenobacter sp.]